MYDATASARDATIRTRLQPLIRAREVLIIGAPHYIAIRVALRILDLEPETQITMVVRPSRIARTQAYLTRRTASATRVRILHGDEAAPNYGLDRDAFGELCERITDVYHCAGLYHVGVAKQQVEEANIRVTRHSLAAARELRSLARFNYLSTAFISGDREGTILERELEQGQAFRSTFERTKFTAELDVQRMRHELPISVYRPSLIVGDSHNGEIDQLDGPYVFVQTIARNPERLPVLLPSAGHYPFNAVPVDFVTEALHAISLMPETQDKTFHLVDPAPVSEASAFRLLRRHILEGPAKATVGGRLRERLLGYEFFEKIARDRRVFMNELDALAIFNPSNTLKALVDTGIACPFFPDYVEHLVDHAQRSVYEW